MLYRLLLFHSGLDLCIANIFFSASFFQSALFGVWMVSLCCCCLTRSDFAFSLSLSSLRLFFGLAIKYSHGEMCVMHMCCWQRFISERIVSRKPFRTFVGVERALCYRFIPLSLSPSLFSVHLFRSVLYCSKEEEKYYHHQLKYSFFIRIQHSLVHKRSNIWTEKIRVQIAMEESEAKKNQRQSAEVLGTTLILC